MFDLKVLTSRRDALRTERAERWDTVAEEIARFIAPERAGFTGSRDTQGDEPQEDQFNNIGGSMARSMASFVLSLAAPSDEKWFSFGLAGGAEPTQDEKEWLEKLEDVVWRDLYDSDSGGEVAINDCVSDIVFFGPAVALVNETPGEPTPFFVEKLDLRNTWFDVDGRKQPSALFSCEDLTARQVASRYAPDGKYDRLPKAIRDDLKRSPKSRTGSETKYDIIQCITRRWDADPRMRDSKSMDWAHIVWEAKSAELILESGFRECPYGVGLWGKTTAGKYGWSPGREALPDLRSINLATITMLEAAQIRATPPAAMVSESAAQANQLKPRGIMLFDAEVARQMRGMPVQYVSPGDNPVIAMDFIEAIERNLGEAFWRYLQQLPTGGPAMTATEILQRKQAFRQIAAPVLGRLQRDFFSRLMDRIVAIELRTAREGSNRLPLPPESMDGTHGRSLQIEFVSPVQRAIREWRAAAVQRALPDLGPILELSPGAADNIDADQAVRDIADDHDIPADWLVPIDVRDKTRAAAQAEQQRQQLLSQALAAGKVIGPDNAAAAVGVGPSAGLRAAA